MNTQGQFINDEIYVWGEDYVLDLIARGYEPVLVASAERAMVKWVWMISEHRESLVFPVSNDCYASDIEG